jgi:hypothetical protein
VIQQRHNETVWRQLLVQGVLAVLLPTEDLENGCLRALVTEIFSEMIMGGVVSERVCEGWMLWESIAKTIETLQPRFAKADQEITKKAGRSVDRLEHFGLLATQTNDNTKRKSIPRQRKYAAHVADLFWLTIQYCFFLSNAVRAVIIAFATSSTWPSRDTIGHSTSPVQSVQQGRLVESKLSAASAEQRHRRVACKRPLLSMSVFSCISTILDMNNRMPWLSGVLALLQWGLVNGPGRIGETDRVVDR